MLRVEPELRANYVAQGTLSLLFSPMLDHGNASLFAHRAAECAGAQEPLAFWHLHDLLFERQNQLWRASAELLVEWATEIGLDSTTFASCLDDPTIAEKVERMDQARRTMNIRIRPSFQLNEQLVEGGIPYQRFVQILSDSGL